MEMYIATYLIDTAALICLGGLILTSTAINLERKKPLLMGIVLTIIIIFSEAGTIFSHNGNINLRNMNIISNVLGFALAPLIPIVITLIFDRRILTSHKFYLIPTVINAAATLLSPLFGYIFYVDAANQYGRGDFFFIFISVYFINFMILIFSTLDVGKMHNYPIMKRLLALSLFTIMGTSIQLIEPLAFSSWHCVALSLFLYFLILSEFDSSFDTLTNLYNRTAFDKAAKEIIRSRPFSVIILDINDFKTVNDTYGHDYGDQVIKIVAKVIRESFGKTYTCYRFGGDEFSVLSTETDHEKIEFQIKMMTDALKEIRGTGLVLPTLSYGFSTYQGGACGDFNQILKEADDQMYHYKKAHKRKNTHEASSSLSLQDT